MGKRFLSLLACLLFAACMFAGVCAAEQGGMITSLSEVKPEIFQAQMDDGSGRPAVQPHYPGVLSGLIEHGLKGVLDVRQQHPVFGNAALDKTVLSAIQGSLSAFTAERLEDYSDEVADKDTPVRLWQHQGKYLLFSSGPDCVTVHLSSYVYRGGVHGGNTHTALVLSRKTGRQLGLGDMFADANMAVSLMSQWATEKLAASLGAAFEKAGAEPRPENFTRIIPVQDGLVMVFEEYQVAPYASGMQVVKMPLNALEKAGPKPGVWGAR